MAARVRETPEAYDRRAIVNAAINSWRTRRRRPESALLPQHDRSSADLTRQVDVRDELIRALLRIPTRQRAVQVLRYFDDLPEREVAAHWAAPSER